jgi:hypothetical protein
LFEAERSNATHSTQQILFERILDTTLLLFSPPTDRATVIVVNLDELLRHQHEQQQPEQTLRRMLHLPSNIQAPVIALNKVLFKLENGEWWIYQVIRSAPSSSLPISSLPASGKDFRLQQTHRLCPAGISTTTTEPQFLAKEQWLIFRSTVEDRCCTIQFSMINLRSAPDAAANTTNVLTTEPMVLEEETGNNFLVPEDCDDCVLLSSQHSLYLVSPFQNKLVRTFAALKNESPHYIEQFSQRAAMVLALSSNGKCKIWNLHHGWLLFEFSAEPRMITQPQLSLGMFAYVRQSTLVIRDFRFPKKTLHNVDLR